MDWLQVDAAYALGAMPARYRARYDLWIAGSIDPYYPPHPEFEARFAEIVEQKVGQARAAIASRESNTLDPDESTLPESTVLPVVNLIVYQAMYEIGDTLALDAELRAMMIRADMHVQSLRFMNIRCEEGEPHPYYVEPETPRGTLL
jgi:hypothetical protein